MKVNYNALHLENKSEIANKQFLLFSTKLFKKVNNN